VGSVFEAFHVFATKNSLTLDEFIDLIPNSVAEGAALNLLRELRNLGLISYQNGFYCLKDENLDVNEETFKDYMYDKFNKHSFTKELQRIEGRAIELKDLTEIIKKKIRTKVFADKTLETYSQIFLSWLDFSGIKIPNLSPTSLRKAKNAVSYTPQMSPQEVEDYLLRLSISTMPTIVNQLAEPVVQILNELNNTFKRAFDLCVLKINSINTGRVTSTNILISILALIVSLLSLFVAIKHPS